MVKLNKNPIIKAFEKEVSIQKMKIKSYYYPQNVGFTGINQRKFKKKDEKNRQNLTKNILKKY